jgi:predicted RNA-binding Zn-ribbon protein involved in translation (DUF1610 family)
MGKIKFDKEFCSECKSEFYVATSEMKGLCPECAHHLYDYKNCDHQIENGRCVKCFWDGNYSEYVKSKFKL